MLAHHVPYHLFQDNARRPMTSLSLAWFLHQLLYKRATIQGILARDFTHRMLEMINHILPWLKAGEIQFKTTEINGFENLPSALEGLFEGKNIGKAIVRVK